jgi:hypothetical protein
MINDISIYNPSTILEGTSTNPILVEEVDLYLCACGKESEYGVHGLKDGVVSSIYYCSGCYNSKRSSSDE